MDDGGALLNIERIDTNKRLSRAVAYGGFVFLSGATASDRRQDIKGQTKEALSRVDSYLAAAGTDKSQVLFVQIWLKDIKRDLAGMNEIWESWTLSNAAPARATSQCEMGAPDVLVEIIVTAAAPRRA